MSSVNMTFWTMLIVYIHIFLLDLYLRYRQYKVCLECTHPPEAVQEFVSQVDYEKSRLYKLDLNRFAFVEKIFDGLGMLVVLCFNPSQWLSEISLQYSEAYIADKGVIWQGSYHLAMFFAIYFSIHLLLQAPLSYYKTFKLEQKHGFKKETVKEFVMEELFSLAFCIAAFSVAPVGLVWLMRITGEQNFFRGWVSICLGTFITAAIYPNVSAFFFDKNSPLQEGRLRKKIFGLASKSGFPLREIYVVSANSSMTEDVCLHGSWDFKYIFLSDELVNLQQIGNSAGIKNLDSKSACSTASNVSSVVKNANLIEQVKDDESLHTCVEDDSHSRSVCEEQDTQSDEDGRHSVHSSISSASGKSAKEGGLVPGSGVGQLGLNRDEVLALVALQIANWKLGHNIVKFLVKQCKTLFWVVTVSAIFYPKEVFDGSCRLNNFLFAQVFSTALGVMLCYLHRRMVFSADSVAVSLVHKSDLHSAMVKLAMHKKDGCMLLEHDAFFSAVNHRTPTVVERVEALKKYE